MSDEKRKAFTGGTVEFVRNGERIDVLPSSFAPPVEAVSSYPQSILDASPCPPAATTPALAKAKILAEDNERDLIVKWLRARSKNLILSAGKANVNDRPDELATKASRLMLAMAAKEIAEEIERNIHRGYSPKVKP